MNEQYRPGSEGPAAEPQGHRPTPDHPIPAPPPQQQSSQQPASAHGAAGPAMQAGPASWTATTTPPNPYAWSAPTPAGGAGSAGSAGHAGGHGHPHGPNPMPTPAPPAAQQATQPGNHPPALAPRGKRQRPWLMVGAAAILSAMLASGGTALALHGIADSSDSALTQVSAGTTVAPAADGSPNWQAVAESVRPSVVAIDAASQRGQGAGSGVIIDADSGYVLTNNHVVEGAQQLAVTLSDGRMYEAEIVGTDPATDLAVLQLSDPPEDLAAATLGTSEDVAVGENVMAVGNPLGLDSTVTTGIVSALDRPVGTTDQQSQESVVTNAIQIDAAINPGNSGGPLFDSEGHVIGITSSIATDGQSSGSIGLGFAIPVDLATNIADQLISDGSAEHAYLGVTLTDETVTADGSTRSGAAVHEVMDGTPAAEAGLQSGDVIVQIDDHAVGGATSLTGYVRTYSSGDQVSLGVVRDGQLDEVMVTLAAREDVTS
ncbi:S1C family serine protease [Ruania halotolerans]|uniref:S1C family serine protease n=1 Tax=Ruania halotolerans TaxID=2897773 RepID=UPI001E4935BC|nr:trypsin-like peptidase domain-containing protein [Ruania halotolerans]UFU05810.1 trypsin-like peptidase domain-containing protein [Ruania halotolerans]